MSLCRVPAFRGAGPFFGEDPFQLTHNSYTLPSGDLSQEFHVYGLVWNETVMQTYIDDINNVVLNVPITTDFFSKGGWGASGLNNPWRGGGMNAPFDQVPPGDVQCFCFCNGSALQWVLVATVPVTVLSGGHGRVGYAPRRSSTSF